MNTHNDKISGIINFIKKNKDNKLTLQRNTSCCLKNDYKKNTIQINISSLNKILEINKEFIITEPLVTMETILNECLKHNLTIPVITEFKHMTIGGALCGGAGESSSFIKGLLHETVLEYEIILGNGDKIIATKDNDYSDIFYAIPGSYGSLGIVTYIKIILENVSKYIKVKYTLVDSLNEVHNILNKEMIEPTCDYLECLGENKKFKIIRAYKEYNLGIYQWLNNLFNLYFFKYIWYYNHVNSINENNYTEYFTYYDYIFRWDRGAFWHASKRLLYSWFNRLFYSSNLTTKKLYKRARRRTHAERESRKINQDMMIPLNKLSLFYNLNESSHNVNPLWILPIVSKTNKYPFFINSVGFYVNIGAYGYIKKDSNFIKLNKELENFLIQNKGMKCMWNECYYDKDQFWTMFNKIKYDNLRYKYNANNFIDLYTKSCSFYNTLKLEPNLEDHQKRYIKLMNDIDKYPDDILIFNRKNENTFTLNKYILQKNQIKVDMIEFNNILHMDLINQEILVEPGVTMQKLFDETSKYNLIPLILPEFKFLTVGGLIQGSGLESSSFKYGQFNDICTELHFIINNKVIIATPNNAYSDLFYGISGSLGGIAILIAAKIKLVNSSSYVTLEYFKFNNLKDGINKLKESYDKEIDFLESIVYSKDKMIVITGSKANRKENLELVNLSSWYSEWFYSHVENTENSKEQLNINDYLFRYDKGTFWMGKYVNIKKIPIGKYSIFRKLFNSYFTTKYLYQKLKSKPYEVRENRFIIQDMYIPHENCLNFLNKINHMLDIYPIWLCPIKTTSNKQYMAPHYTDKYKYMIDVGLWGIPKFGYPFDGKRINKQIEKILSDNDGKKMNYGKFYYNREEINKIYEIDNYLILRDKYNSGRLKNYFN